MKDDIIACYHKFKENAFFRRLLLLTIEIFIILYKVLLNRNLWTSSLSKVVNEIFGRMLTEKDG